MKETILSNGFLEDDIQRCQTDSPQEKAGQQKQRESVAKELRQVEQMETRLSKQKAVATNFKVDFEEFRHLMRLELRREETRKAALHALIEEIVVYPDALIEMKDRIRNRYRTAFKAVEDGQYPRVCTATAVQTPATAVSSYLQTWQYVSARS